MPRLKRTNRSDTGPLYLAAMIWVGDLVSLHLIHSANTEVVTTEKPTFVEGDIQ